MTDGAEEEVKEASLYATELFVQLGHICRRILAGNRSLAYDLGTISLKRLSSTVGSSVLVSKTLQHRPHAERQAVERAAVWERRTVAEGGHCGQFFGD